MAKLTPDALLNYAVAYTKERVAQKAHTLYPTFREASRKFRCRISDIESAIYDYQGRGYLNSVVGFQCDAGTSGIKNKGDLMIEAQLAESESG